MMGGRHGRNWMPVITDIIMAVGDALGFPIDDFFHLFSNTMGGKPLDSETTATMHYSIELIANWYAVVANFMIFTTFYLTMRYLVATVWDHFTARRSVFTIPMYVSALYLLFGGNQVIHWIVPGSTAFELQSAEEWNVGFGHYWAAIVGVVLADDNFMNRLHNKIYKLRP